MRKALLNSLQIFNKKPTIQWGDGDGKMGRVGEWGKERGGEGESGDRACNRTLKRICHDRA
ncbi:MAG: hypothetical protein HC849_00765 [Oscillatoriales cyanobacterium RU_3_3]|nr:hypothetical protein [Oscillatoriales cyanobacterium RU_3_3]